MFFFSNNQEDPICRGWISLKDSVSWCLWMVATSRVAVLVHKASCKGKHPIILIVSSLDCWKQADLAQVLEVDVQLQLKVAGSALLQVSFSGRVKEVCAEVYMEEVEGQLTLTGHSDDSESVEG